MTSKVVIKHLFSGKKPSRIPFIPFGSTFAAGLRQIPVQEMLSCPTVLSNSLQDAVDLFGYDCITNVFDNSLEAEACGCEIDWSDHSRPPVVTSHPLDEGMEPDDLDFSNLENMGRIPVVLESTKRIAQLKGKELGLAGTVTGPLTLARHLRGDDIFEELNRGDERALKILELAGKIALKVAKSYCEKQVNLIVITEEYTALLDHDRYPMVGAVVKSIVKVSKFYGAGCILYMKECNREQLESICSAKIGIDGISVGGIDPFVVKDIAKKANIPCFGACIPLDVLKSSPAEVQEYMNDLLGKAGDSRFFISGEWEIPYGTPAENLHIIKACMDDYAC